MNYSIVPAMPDAVPQNGAAVADAGVDFVGAHARIRILAPMRVLGFAVEEMEVRRVGSPQDGWIAPGDLAEFGKHGALARELAQVHLPADQVGVLDRRRQGPRLAAANQQPRPPPTPAVVRFAWLRRPWSPLVKESALRRF